MQVALSSTTFLITKRAAILSGAHSVYSQLYLTVPLKTLRRGTAWLSKQCSHPELYSRDVEEPLHQQADPCICSTPRGELDRNLILSSWHCSELNNAESRNSVFCDIPTAVTTNVVVFCAMTPCGSSKKAHFFTRSTQRHISEDKILKKY
jgi:hypothetical protein